jgi:hypothetical protein
MDGGENPAGAAATPVVEAISPAAMIVAALVTREVNRRVRKQVDLDMTVEPLLIVKPACLTAQHVTVATPRFCFLQQRGNGCG